MSWITTINYSNAEGALKKIYERVKGPNNTIDNVLQLHSLRPHTLMGHMTLYKSVLHHRDNTLPKWFLEALGVYVSQLNSCDYCVAHHSEGFKQSFSNQEETHKLLERLKSGADRVFSDSKLDKGIAYAKKLTITPNEMQRSDVLQLVESGFTDGEVLEINQVTAYFNYVNRSVLGLGVRVAGEALGLAPRSDQEPDDWTHH